MASLLDGLVTVNVTTAGATPQLANSNTPAFLAYHTLWGDFIRTFTSPSDWTAVSNGGLVTDPAYLWLTSVFGQTPAPASAKIIRGSTSVTQTVTFLVTDITNGDSVGLSFQGVNGVVKDLHVTVSGSPTAIAIAGQIVALGAPNGFTIANGGTATVTIAATAAGKIGYPSLIKGGTYTDNTPSATVATDLNNAVNVDPSFYGITGEHQDATNITAVSTWALSNKRLHCYTTADTANLGVATGIGATLKLAGSTYDFGMYSGTPASYGASALEAQRFTATPGSDTWAYKQLAGVTADTLTPTQIVNLNGNNLNYYLANVAGVNITLTGIDASGMYADIRRGIDALISQIQINVYTLLVTLPKVPFDPGGIALVGNAVSTALQQYTASNNTPAALLRGDTGFVPQVFLPNISATTTSDRAQRILRNVTFTAYAQSAVQTVQINGTVNF